MGWIPVHMLYLGYRILPLEPWTALLAEPGGGDNPWSPRRARVRPLGWVERSGVSSLDLLFKAWRGAGERYTNDGLYGLRYTFCRCFGDGAALHWLFSS